MGTSQKALYISKDLPLLLLILCWCMEFTYYPAILQLTQSESAVSTRLVGSLQRQYSRYLCWATWASYWSITYTSNIMDFY
uniref:Uncharacterized protein n=1 Tax=Panstrongylus lignarius TaxID=156445 RepID=A0A224XWF3_9HEMI